MCQTSNLKVLQMDLSSEKLNNMKSLQTRYYVLLGIIQLFQQKVLPEHLFGLFEKSSACRAKPGINNYEFQASIFLPFSLHKPRHLVALPVLKDCNHTVV